MLETRAKCDPMALTQIFISKNDKKSPCDGGPRPQCLSYISLLNTSPKLHICTF